MCVQWCAGSFCGIVKHYWLTDQQTVLPLEIIFGHFGPFLGPPWALGFLKHLHKEPDVYIYPLAMAPAKKPRLILNYFHFYSFFFGRIVSGRFFSLLCQFWTLIGGKNSSVYDHIKLGPYFHPLTVRLAQKPSLFSNFDGFYQFSPSCGHFWPFLAIFGHFWLFLGIFGHNLGSINDRKLVLVSNIRFWDELFGKNF